MCGRYTLGNFDWVDPAFHTDLASLGDLVARPRYNIAPGQLVLAITRGGGRHVAEAMQWGLRAPWRGGPARLINARAEKLAESRFWRSLIDGGRCVIPADGFYEWRAAGAASGRKRPYWFSRAGGEGFVFAGLWRATAEHAGEPPVAERECVIVTVDANELVAGVHDRMPAMLAPEQAGAWLGGDAHTALAALAPFASAQMSARPVSSAVGSPLNEGAKLIEPAPLAPGDGDGGGDAAADEPLF